MKAHRTVGVYTGNLAGELAAEAKRLDRPVSWLLRRAWLLARARIRKLPAARPTSTA